MSYGGRGGGYSPVNTGPLKVTSNTSRRSTYTGRMYNPNQIQQMIISESRKAGVDPRTMLMIAHIETGGRFDPDSVNKDTRASGLYQIMPANFRNGLNSRNVFDPLTNIREGIKHYKANTSYFRNKVGRMPSAQETYMLHQQGMGGGTALLMSPNKQATAVLKPFYKRGIEVAAVTKNGGSRNMTAGQFTGIFHNKANKILSQY